MPPQPPELMDELVEEVLLRFPPDDPASLVRGAIVCKLWCRLVTGTMFRRRFRDFHRSKRPFLGVIYTGNCKLRHDDDDDDAPRDTDPSLKPVRVMPSPTADLASFRSVHAADDRYRHLSAIDARHGRVLLCWGYPWKRFTIGLSIWDPVTGEYRDLPEPPPLYTFHYAYAAAVVCAATAGGNCDHLDCHRGPFHVVLMDFQTCTVHFSVYSSEAGAWSQLPDFELPLPRRLGCFPLGPRVLAGSAFYLLVRLNDVIVKYDFATQEVSAIPLPSKILPLKLSIVLTDDDGEIGFVVNKKDKRRDFSSAPGTTTTPADETACEANTRMAQH